LPQEIAKLKCFLSYFQVPPVRDFHSVFDVVFIDTSGYMNLCANVGKVTYEMVS